jgi:hypothetical protein
MAKNLESGEDRQGNGETESGWDAASNSAVRALLDHLAAELAAEYVRLMKEAAAASCRPEKTSDREE